MSDNIPPFDTQMEIIKKVSDVKALLQFRSVSKPWKSFIDSSQFIKGYGAGQRSLFLSLGVVKKFILLVEDDKNNEIQQQEFAPSVVSPLLSKYFDTRVIGTSHGLLCASTIVYGEGMAVIWNPSIRKSIRISLPSKSHYPIGFGVCPVTRDPTVLSVYQKRDKPRHFEVFTLSSGVWNVIPTGNVLGQSIKLMSTQVVIDRFIYWGAIDDTYVESTRKHLVVSFDLVTKEFKVVDLPDSFTNELCSYVDVSKLRESLVVSGRIEVEGPPFCDVWIMEHDSSFKRLFTIRAPVHKLLGFKQNGEAILEAIIDGDPLLGTSLAVYDPCSQQIKILGISGHCGTFFMGSYQESLLLFDHPDSHIYAINN